MRSRKVEKLILLMCMLVASLLIGHTKVQAASVVSKRIAEVKKQYPQGKKFRRMVFVVERNNRWDYNIDTMAGGCDGLVAYTTLKVFHSPFAHGSKQYKKIGTASTSSTSKMRKLFKKAKKGDVVYIYKGNSEKHAMIFLSDNSSGIKVYEANFGARDKVWYNHTWKYKNFKRWSHGGTKVSLYHSKNYTSVNKKKAAVRMKIGTRITMHGYVYEVKNNSIAKASMKLIGKSSEPANGYTGVATYIGVNNQRAKYNNYEFIQFGPYTPWQGKQYVTYNKVKYLKVVDEEFFKVIK